MGEGRRREGEREEDRKEREGEGERGTACIHYELATKGGIQGSDDHLEDHY